MQLTKNINRYIVPTMLILHSAYYTYYYTSLHKNIVNLMIHYNLKIEPWVTKTCSRDHIIITNISLLIHKIFND